MTRFDSVVDVMRKLDWEDMETVEATARQVLREIEADRSILREAYAAVSGRPDLLELCESPDPQDTADLGQQLDKVVLYADAASGVRVRIHVFWEGYYDIPHNHRPTFASLVMKGSLQHSIFGQVGSDETVYSMPMRPLVVREELPGTVYALHHSALHAVVAGPRTVTLVVRGPMMRDRSFVIDPNTGRPVWHYGARHETPEQLAAKRMSVEQLHALGENLREWGVF